MPLSTALRAPKSAQRHSPWQPALGKRASRFPSPSPAMGSTPRPHSPLVAFLPEPQNWSLSSPTRTISIRRCGFSQASARQLFRYRRVEFRLVRSRSRIVQVPLAGLAPAPRREQTVTSSPCTRWLRPRVSPRARHLLMSMPQSRSPLQRQSSAVRTRAEFRPSVVRPLIDVCGQGAFRHSPK
ncbi:unannotated protein [freshwater metagenome]|uniref:Unannotated protein n=1 Tax=freshwater metagenome TaxID=449393 RepID=A0A6J6DRE4_9ZZZZ